MKEKLKEKLVDHLEKWWAINKAKGLMAQLLFKRELKAGVFSEHRRKFFGGCWILAPKREDFFKLRICFFVHPTVLESRPGDEVEPEAVMGEAEGLKFRMVAGFLNRAGMGVVYAVPTGQLPLPPEKVQWILYRYNAAEERLRRIDESTFFSRWRGRGRPGRGEKWDPHLKESYLALEEEELVSLFLNEAFYTSFLKGSLKKSVSDPYDIDGFLLSYSRGMVLPLEIKEKFPAKGGDGDFFGVDAGRVLMLLRLCLPTDTNALYVISEVREADRSFVNWKFVLLSEIIAAASWNLQKGGRGMGRQETQTIRLPYSAFRQLEPSILNDSNLEKIGSLPDEVKRLAQEFKAMLEKEPGWR